MKAYLLLTAITMILGVQFTVLQTYQKHAGAGLVPVFRIMGLAAFLSVLVILPCNGFHWRCTPHTLLYAAMMSVFCSVAFLIGSGIARSGSAALFTFFLMSGGMLVPYLWGVLMLGEPAGPAKTAGVLLLLAGLLLSSLGGQKARREGGGGGKLLFALSCLAVFLLNGFAMVAQKSNMVGDPAKVTGALDFALNIYAVMTLFCGGALLVNRLAGAPAPKPELPPLSPVRTLLLMLAFALLSTTAAVLQLFTAVSVPATFMYPMMLGGTMLFTGLCCYLILGERPSPWALAGMAIAVLAAPLFA